MMKRKAAFAASICEADDYIAADRAARAARADARRRHAAAVADYEAAAFESVERLKEKHMQELA
jgi:hypothetical protein